MGYAIALPAALAAILGIVDFFRPITGIAGTPGLGLAIAGAVAVTLAGLILPHLHRGFLRGLVMVLTPLGAILTALAGYFLDSTGIVVLMLLALIGWLFFLRARS